jgi:two-component system OmpR family response regulator
MKALVVEDDRKLSSFLARAFAEEGYTVDSCRTGVEAIAQAAASSYDLVVLDWMLPEYDGLAVCRELRRVGSGVPILMLTARGEVTEKVMALDAGADDYMTKPFHLDELMARARALTRRTGPLRDGMLRAGPVALDIRQRVAQVGEARIELTGREFALLALLVRHAGRVVTRSEILEQVWGLHFDPGSNVIEVHMRHLREKLLDAAACIETVRGQGYRFSGLLGNGNGNGNDPGDPDNGKDSGPPP